MTQERIENGILGEYCHVLEARPVMVNYQPGKPEIITAANFRCPLKEPSENGLDVRCSVQDCECRIYDSLLDHIQAMSPRKI